MSAASPTADRAPERPRAQIRTVPEDFVVDELPAYATSGKGEHLFVTFRKRGHTTPDAVRMLAQALEVDPRGAGWAGMKDRHAVTTQTASFPVPMVRSLDGIEARLALPGIEILGVARHDNKLKPGHLHGNRFTLILRRMDEAGATVAEQRFREIGAIGVPNTFGPQRFGRDGDNPARALAWLAGKERGPRDRRQQTLLFSALQSLLFNQLLALREQDGTWATVLAGDVAKKHDSGGLFVVPAEGPELEDAQARAAAGALSATGPIFGAKMRWPEGAPAELERSVLQASDLGEPGKLEAWKHLGEGSRRVLRLEVKELTVTRLPGTDPTDPDGRNVGLAVSFVLPKGGYATTVLGQACQITDAQSRVSEARVSEARVSEARVSEARVSESRAPNGPDAPPADVPPDEDEPA